ncbi:hypothetical protein PENTCL1PPCAC_24997, partial [Pristionchus entomophagus]
RPAKVKKEEQEDDKPVFVSRKGPPTLATLPRLVMERICASIAAGGLYEEIGNLREVNRDCRESVTSYLFSKPNIPEIDYISLTGMKEIRRSSFNLELGIQEDRLPLHLNLIELKKRITNIDHYDFKTELVWVTIPV